MRSLLGATDSGCRCFPAVEDPDLPGAELQGVYRSGAAGAFVLKIPLATESVTRPNVCKNEVLLLPAYLKGRSLCGVGRHSDISTGYVVIVKSTMLN